jgi:hypothetical protein
MYHAIADLGRNLKAGVRLALFMPVTRLAFRIDLAQLLLVFAFSTVIDIATDWIHIGSDVRFSWFGAGGELFTIGVLLLVAATQALMFRQRALALAVPVLALASYPISQVVHVAPYAFAAYETWAGPTAAAAFEIVMAAWSVAVLVRAVAVALVGRYRAWLALAGGAMLAVPIAFSSLLLPTATWWQARGGSVDSRYPNPASEPVLAAQQTLLDDALSDLDDETPGRTDVYFVGFLGDGHDDAYRQDMLAARRAMGDRFDMHDRAIALVTSPATQLDTPMATVSHLRETLKEVAAAINPDEDVVMLYLAGPSGSDGSLDVSLPPLELLPLSPATLRTLLDEAGIRWRIIIVSSCHSAAFVGALKNEMTLVLAAGEDGPQGGCALRNGSTRLGATLFRDAFPRSESLQHAFEAAKAEFQRDGAGGAQLFIGSDIEQKMKELDRGRANRASGRTV